LLLALFIAPIIISSSCKENAILPPDLVPDVDNIFTFLNDTSTIVSHNVIQDSIITGGSHGGIYTSTNAAYVQPIGCINDAVFGDMKAGTFLQFNVASPGFEFKGPGTIIDSVVVSIPYAHVYGDTSGSSVMQTFNLYQSDSNYTKDTLYYGFDKPSFNPSPLATISNIDFRTFKNDSPTINGVKTFPQLRFQMPQSYIDSLEAQVATSGGAFENFSSFLDWHKGFYIEPANNMGSNFGYFNVYSARMHVYYRYMNTNVTPNVQDTTVGTFTFNPTYNNRWTHIERNYLPPASNYINVSPPPVNGDSLLFIETQPGAAAQLVFPYIDELDNAVINKAELVLTVVSPFTNFSDSSALPVPGQLQVLREEDGVDLFIEDYALLGTAFVDGTRQQVTINGVDYTQYKLNITNTIQKAISEQDNDFRLKVMGRQNVAFLASTRAVLVGSGSSNQLLKPKLNIIFTKLN